MARIEVNVKPERIRSLLTIAALVFALPLGWKSLTGVFTWLSPFIMLNSVFVLKSFVLLNLAGIITLIASVFKARFFCRFLCPAGWCCDRVSGISPRKPSTHSKIRRIGGILAVISLTASLAGLPALILLDPMALFHSFFSISAEKPDLLLILSFSGFPLLLFLNFLYPHLWCGKLCPLGGLQDLFTEAKNLGISLMNKQKINSSVYSPARRLFIASGIGLISGVAFRNMDLSSGKAHFRPPASVDPSIFNTLCIRCGNCIKACPTRIITHHSDPGDPLSWMTPEVSFAGGYCLETCNLCGQVCPTGSITLFSPEAKNRIFMGSAYLVYEDCLLAKNSECDRCKVACKYDAILIEAVPGSLLMKPFISEAKCVGCGACAVICPAATINMTPPSTA